jgi:hypothetical protein
MSITFQHMVYEKKSVLFEKKKIKLWKKRNFEENKREVYEINLLGYFLFGFAGFLKG